MLHLGIAPRAHRASTSRARGLALNLLLLGGGVLAALVLLELGLRANARIPGNAHRIRVLQGPSHLPCTVISDLRVSTIIDGQDVLIETNSVGMRWREVARAKAPEVRRIAFIGDSFTFGLWSPSAETSFVGVVDALFGPRGFEVLNFGVPGDGPKEAELRLASTVLGYEPDYLVLSLFNGNDLSNTHLGATKTDCETGLTKRSLMRSRVPSRFRERPAQALMTALDSRFRVVHAMRVAKGRLTGDVRFARSTDEDITDAPFPIEERFFAYPFWSRVDYPPVAVAAKDELLATVARIHDLAEARGVRLFLTAIPFREQVYAATPRGEGYDVGLPQRYFSELARDRGIPYYDLLPDLRAYVRDCGSAIYVSDDPHLNGTGHRVVGELMARFLDEALELDGEGTPAASGGDGRLCELAGVD